MNSTPAMQEPTPLWTKAQVEAWLAEHATDDIRFAIVLASDIVYDYEQERRRLTAQVASLQEKVQGLIRLSNENAEIGARHMQLGNAAMEISLWGINVLGAKEQRIRELEAQLSEANDQLTECSKWMHANMGGKERCLTS